MADTQNEYRIVGYLGNAAPYETDQVMTPRSIHKNISTKALAEHALLAAQLENLTARQFDRIELQERTLTDWQ